MLTQPANPNNASPNDPQGNDTSYVSAYNPPTQADDQGNMPTPPAEPPMDFPSADMFKTPNSDSAKPSSDTMVIGDAGQASTPTPVVSTSSGENTSEAIEDQNIFNLLGVNDGTDQEKERFLDELQQVIWEDFLEVDLDLLVTREEASNVKAILNDANKSEESKQEEALSMLENLIPDLEEIMLEKALELKEDMVKERIAGMKEFYSGNQQALDSIKQAEDLLAQDKWASAAQVLNSLN